MKKHNNILAFKPKIVSVFILGLVLLFGFSACRQVYHLADASEHQYEVSESYKSDSIIDAIVLPYKLQLDSLMDTKIGVNATLMTKDKPESTLGNWMTDIIYVEAAKRYDGQLDFAIQNYGGIRISSLGAGDITVRNIYELMPFDNEMVVIEARGVIVKELFEKVSNSSGWPVSSQVKLIISDKSISSLEINGNPIDLVKTYRFALPDYIANGGDGSDFLVNQPRKELNIKIRDAIIAHLEEKDDIIQEESRKDGRIQIKN